jgi:hypothetical protein
MYDFTRNDIDLEAIRKRIAAMSDAQLLEYGRAAATMARRSKRETWCVQLAEARAEWHRRRAASVSR